MVNIIRSFKQRFNVISQRLIFILRNVSLHGTHHIVKPDRSIIWKVFYTIIYVTLWYLMVSMLIRTTESYLGNPIRFTMQTTYMSWNTTFPAITICEIFNLEKIWNLSGLVNINVTNVSYNEYYGEISFFSGTCYSCIICEQGLCPTDFSNLLQTFRAPCSEVFINCKWNGVPFDCCSNFLPIETEYGNCYSINSKHYSNVQYIQNDLSRPSFISNRRIGPGKIEITLSQDVEAFMHASDDIPIYNTETDVRHVLFNGVQYSVDFTVIDTVNEQEMLLISPERRQCRFENEVPEDFKTHSKYSYSVCVLQCRINAQLEMCNCTHHLMPSIYEEQYCDLAGLKCLTDNYEVLSNLRGGGFEGAGIECSCLASCTEPEYTVVRVSSSNEGKAHTMVEFNLLELPANRYTRQIAHSRLDLVVAIGNALGFFFGASLLTIVELVYFLCCRNWRKT